MFCLTVKDIDSRRNTELELNQIYTLISYTEVLSLYLVDKMSYRLDGYLLYYSPTTYLKTTL